MSHGARGTLLSRVDITFLSVTNVVAIAEFCGRGEIRVSRFQL